MTRINTNISSLVAQNVLSRTNSQLQQSLTRLSTGLRINSGKDDPAGLIASEILRSDIVSVQKAISNSERANQVIGMADSTLGEVSSLLNDIRALVTEAANAGALSEEQIDANQLQVASRYSYYAFRDLQPLTACTRTPRRQVPTPSYGTSQRNQRQHPIRDFETLQQTKDYILTPLDFIFTQP